MTTRKAKPLPIEIMAGVQPSTDKDELSTPHYTASAMIRFVDGMPWKIGGWAGITFDSLADKPSSISGLCRSIYSQNLNDKARTLIGTHSKLYDLFGTVLTNITPLATATTTIANSIDTDYATLGTDPLTTTNASTTVSIADTGAEGKYKVGDTYTLSGFSGAQNGIPDTELNTDHVIRAVSTNTVQVRVTTAATSSGSTGGASIVRATGLLTFNATAHGQSNLDRVKITGAADTGGITATTEINIEHIVRNSDTNTFDVMTTGTATSSVSGGGGASTAYQIEIADGSQDESFGQGYGMGKYGVGLYGVSKTSTNNRVFPRRWFFDRYGEEVIMTAGEGSGVYNWDGSTATAPALISNAPTQVNYAFVSDNILVTLGADTVENRVKASDQNNITNWTSSSTNQVFADDIEGAGRFLSHAGMRGLNLLFTENQTYTMRKIPREAGVWEIKQIDPTIGIISPMSRVVVGSIPYWMGKENFYMWRGGNVEIIPSNTSQQSTLLKYVYDNINISQSSKFFAWYNYAFQEVWFHYCSAGANEPDRVAVVNLQDFSWYPLEMDRTAGEYPVQTLDLPRLINSSSTLYRHETGYNDDGSGLSWSLTTNKRGSGASTAKISAVIPNYVTNDDVTLDLDTYLFPESTTKMFDNSYTLTSTTGRVPTQAQGRVWQYTISGSAVDQSYKGGNWHEEIQESSRN